MLVERQFPLLKMLSKQAASFLNEADLFMRTVPSGALKQPERSYDYADGFYAAVHLITASLGANEYTKGIDGCTLNDLEAITNDRQFFTALVDLVHRVAEENMEGN